METLPPTTTTMTSALTTGSAPTAPMVVLVQETLAMPTEETSNKSPPASPAFKAVIVSATSHVGLGLSDLFCSFQTWLVTVECLDLEMPLPRGAVTEAPLNLATLATPTAETSSRRRPVRVESSVARVSYNSVTLSSSRSTTDTCRHRRRRRPFD